MIRLIRPTTVRIAVIVVVLTLGAYLGSFGARNPGVVSVALTNTQGSGPIGSTSAPSGGSSSKSSHGGGPPASSSSSASSKSSSGTSTSGAGSSSSSGSAPSHGQLLSTSQFGPISYQIYPSRSSSAVQAAEDGFTIHVAPTSGGMLLISIKSQFPGGPSLQQKALGTDHVYWVEANYGDDAPGQDGNLGDEGVLLTDAQGYIVNK